MALTLPGFDLHTPIDVFAAASAPNDASAYVYLLAEGDKGPVMVSIGKEGLAAAEKIVAAKAINGADGDVTVEVVEHGGKFVRIVVLGVGPIAKLTSERLRCVAGTLAGVITKQKCPTVSVYLPKVQGLGPAKVAEAFTTGLYLASYNFKQFHGTLRKKKPNSSPALTRYHLVAADKSAMTDAQSGVARAAAVATGVNLARSIANTPANIINPPELADLSDKLAKALKIQCKVIDEKQAAKLGMGGLVAVGAGSISTPPRLIALEYSGPKAKVKPLLIVGKSITFDTGGISIKPADKMGKMIYDKCGGMAVLGLMTAVALLKLPIHIVGLLPAAENHISSKAYRPGDILTMYNGVTVEITNTDAEGRLVLGDALAWGIETYKPQACIDLATLTGACVVALGTTMAGLFANDDNLAGEIEAASRVSGEKLWRLPVGDDQRQMLKSDHADLVNSPGRWGGALTAAAFLSHFIGEDATTPWAHLDIAGVADTEKDLPYMSKGSTGYGVRLLTEWVAARCAEAAAR